MAHAIHRHLGGNDSDAVCRMPAETAEVNIHNIGFFKNICFILSLMDLCFFKKEKKTPQASKNFFGISLNFALKHPPKKTKVDGSMSAVSTSSHSSPQ